MSPENTSGLVPVEFNCVFRPDKVEEKTSGGIIIVDTQRDREQYAAVEGVLVATSQFAFDYADGWVEGTKPKPGDRIAIAKYAGTLIKGKDGEEYRIIKDKDILAVRAKS